MLASKKSARGPSLTHSAKPFLDLSQILWIEKCASCRTTKLKESAHGLHIVTRIVLQENITAAVDVPRNRNNLFPLKISPLQ